MENKWIGNIGERLNGLELKVVFIKQFESEWGTTSLHKFVDGEGNSFSWFSSSKTLEHGQTYRLNGTVKKHEEYKDRKTTMLTRCLKIEEL